MINKIEKIQNNCLRKLNNYKFFLHYIYIHFLPTVDIANYKIL